MNAQVQAITDALKMDNGSNLHESLVVKSQALRKTLDKITGAVTDREAKYARLAELREELKASADENYDDEERTPVKIASDLKRANDAIDKEIDKVYDLIAEADTLRDEVAGLCQQIATLPLVATAA